jgi:2-polyprenyl-3-methyl-5-hydroxy-6-metoxy-1,4-benzoquinol methylase
VGQDETAPYSSQPLTGVAPGAPTEKAGARMAVRDALEHMIAVTYGVTYDAVVTRFPAYDAMIEEVVGFVGRSVPAEATPRSVRVLDVACGIGNVSIRLSREGYSVVGIDGVRHLVEIAREKTAQRRANLTFQHFDIAREPLPGAGHFDVLVSMHTLYWHPQPAALLEGCRHALRTGGHAVFLTYGRPASVIRTFRELWVAKGLGAAVRALRWLLPTALFELFRDCEHRYLSTAEFHDALRRAGFEVLEARDTFLSDLSHLAWCRAR